VKVLVTGGSGFVGGALIERLLAEGIAVRGSWWRAPPPTRSQVEWWRLSSVQELGDCRELVRGCEVVIHLAALAHQLGRAAAGRAEEFWRTNVELTRALARASRQAGVQRLVFVSSVAAVCVRSAQAIDEDRLCAPEDDYGRSKLAAEQALQSELRGTTVDWCILRPPLVYGPGNPGNMARLLRLIGTGMPLPFGAIYNRRSFMYVDNLVDALLTVVRYPGEIRGTFFVGDGSDFATPQLVAALAAAIQRKPRLLPVPVALLRLAGRTGDLAARFMSTGGIDSYSIGRLVDSLPVSSDRFRRFFSWHPPVDVRHALQHTGAAWRGAGKHR
jgi:nucleoside-diphosphate-sugar epimerase